MTEVKAYAVLEAGGALEPYSFRLPPLGPGEVDIAVNSCGICHSDLSIINNHWGVTHYPLVPGHEVIGTVKAIGEGVRHLSVGQSVGVGWMAGSCLSCQPCMSGSHHHCNRARPTIIGRHGGFADSIRTQAAWTVALPDGLDVARAGPLFCGGVTVFSPLVDYNISPTDRIAVVGIGGLGHLAIKFLKAWGCEVTAFTTSPDKTEELKRLGAHHVVNSRDEDALKALRGRFNAVISTVNVGLPWHHYIAALAPKGRLITVGIVGKPMEISAGALVTGQKGVCGSDTGSPAMIARMLDFCARHDILPETEIFKMEDVNKAVARLESGQARYRVVLERN